MGGSDGTDVLHTTESSCVLPERSLTEAKWVHRVFLQEEDPSPPKALSDVFWKVLFSDDALLTSGGRRLPFSRKSSRMSPRKRLSITVHLSNVESGVTNSGEMPRKSRCML